jgi:hypothetical protein
MSNYKKSSQLGLSFGKANGILKKSLLFYFVKKCGVDTCYRCNKKIEKIDDLSIEHKVPWLDSEDPKKLFFDINNISFSHLHCNIKEFRSSTKILKKDGYIWCWDCKIYKPINEFPFRAKNKTVFQCTKCYSKYKAEFRSLHKEYNSVPGGRSL